MTKNARITEEFYPKGNLKSHMKYAAIIAIILSSSFGLYTWMNNPESQMVAVTVRAGSKAEMALPDGTSKCGYKPGI